MTEEPFTPSFTVESLTAEIERIQLIALEMRGQKLNPSEQNRRIRLCMRIERMMQFRNHLLARKYSEA